MSLSDLTSYVIYFAELKFRLEKWHRGEFDFSRNVVKRVIFYHCLFIKYKGGRFLKIEVRNESLKKLNVKTRENTVNK